MKLILALVLLIAPALADENWPHWRGAHDNGSADSGTYLEKFDAVTSVLWKTPLPGKGCSTPIVWNRRIFVTAPIEGQDGLLALDWSGKLLWKVTFGAENPGRHKNGSGCNPSPVTDGQTVFVYFKSGNFAAVDFEGKLLWKTNLVERYGKDNLYWDYGISPVLTERSVIFAKIHHADAWLAAFDKATGKLQWKVARNYETATEGDHSYATPLLFKQEGREALLVLGGEHVDAHDARDGKLLWSCGNFNPEERKNWVPVASPVISGDMAVVPYGRGGRLHGIKLGGKGDVTKTHRLWLREDTGAFVPTPAERNGLVYVLRDQGEIDCVAATTGRTVWSGALPKVKDKYYASPLVADGKLYAAREDGIIYVARADGKFEVLAENNMGERVIASPVPVSNRLLIRGEKHLFCIGKP